MVDGRTGGRAAPSLQSASNQLHCHQDYFHPHTHAAITAGVVNDALFLLWSHGGSSHSPTQGCQTPGCADFLNRDVFPFFFPKEAWQKGSRASLARPGKGVNSIPSSDAVSAAEAAVLKAGATVGLGSPSVFGDLSLRDRDCRTSAWVPVSICCFWHRTSDTDDATFSADAL